MDSFEQISQDIKNLKIQGATAIARAGLLSLKKVRSKDLKKAVKQLIDARPTEPLLQNCISFVLWQLKKEEKIEKAVDLILTRLSDIEEAIIKKGTDLIQPGARILTHCHSSTVEKILKNARRKGVEFTVYVTETRPLFQGRITAKNLIQAGIETTMITDAAAPYTLSHLDQIEIDLVLLGADAISLEGSCVNKIGSFAISLACQEAKIPLYVLSTLLKFDSQAKTGKEIKIEARQAAEVWENPPQELRIINPAFDLIPADKITAYCTEYGILKPKKIANMMKKNYPWIMKKSKIKSSSGARVGENQKLVKRFSYFHLGEKFNPQKHLLATFRLETDGSFEQAAEQVAAESSIGTWTKITQETKKIFRQLSAKIFEINSEEKIIKVAYPLALFEAGNIPQLLSSVAGNIFGMKKIDYLRLEDLELPEKFVKSFSGPGVGLEGIRKYLGIRNRPVLCSIIKPKEGLSAKKQVEIAKQLFQAGIDLVKDDENLTSPVFNPFEQRLVLMMKEIKTLAKPKLYAFNITAPYDLMIKRAQLAKRNDSRCVMIDFLTVGFAALQSLRIKFPDLIIHGHRAMHAALTRNKRHGLSMLVLAKLARLAGIDQLHTGTIIGKMEGSLKEVILINQFLRSEWYGIKPVLPIASGGLYPALIPSLIKILGKKMVFAFGGGIHGHPQGVTAGARAVVEAMEASQKRISLSKYSRFHPFLSMALATWPEGKW